MLDKFGKDPMDWLFLFYIITMCSLLVIIVVGINFGMLTPEITPASVNNGGVC